MGEPVILVVDDDGDALEELTYLLRRRFGADYRVVAAGSAGLGLRVLEGMRAEREQVAVIIADQWMPELTGFDFLGRAHELHPAARRALLFDAFDRNVQERLVQAMALGRVDSWLIKPWDPDEQRLYPRVGELLADWVEVTGQPGYRAVRIVAEPWTPRAHEMRDLLYRNGIPTDLLTPRSDEGRQLLEETGQPGAQLPVVVFFDGRVLVDPSNAEVAKALRVRIRPAAERYDLTIIGSGPAGLSAAVYGASEGLSTLLVDSHGMGGQAGTSSLIRNYLGFPRGVTGRHLATLASEQSMLFGAEYVFGHATRLATRGPDRVATLADGTQVASRAVVISVGVEYRRLTAPGVEELLGAGVFYGAAVSEARALRGQPVFVVGAGNSGGQAATHLAKYAERVTLLARGATLTSTMSDYLIKEIEATPNITVRLGTTVTGAGGAGRLEHLSLYEAATDHSETVPASALFLLIGAQPHTQWLNDVVARDANGFLLTGRDLAAHAPPSRWALQRDPFPLETSIPGVFAAGDVRQGSVKRVASAVGEGAIAIQYVHEYLALIDRT
jgi:thioredoxin reductase (NADPH)